MSGWVHAPKTYRTFQLDAQGRDMLTRFFNQRRANVFHDENRQVEFLRLLDGVLAFVNVTREVQGRYDNDHPKLKPGERHDAHEINMARLIAASIAQPFERIFETPASGKENSVFFQLVNQILHQIELKTEDGRQLQLGRDALKTTLSGQARKKV
jgi:hypothetical protein